MVLSMHVWFAPGIGGVKMQLEGSDTINVLVDYDVSH